MEKKIPDKIHIIGSVGSGKTTLARNLSQMYHIPYYELDNVVWKRHHAGDIRRTEGERDRILDEIIHTKKWIIEGAHNHSWVRKSFQAADIIIFLDTPYLVRIHRITSRFIRQILRVEAGHYKPSIKIFMKMFEWNQGFEKESKPKILKMLKQEKMNAIILKNNRNIDI